MTCNQRAIRVGGVPFEVSRLEEASSWVVASARRQNRRGIAVRLANTYCVALAAKDRDYGELLKRSRGVNFPDGLPVVASMRVLTRTIEPRRVRGPSLFRRVIEDGQASGVRHFFLGSTPEVLYKLEATLRSSFPGVNIAGSYSPPFADLDDQYLEDLVQQARHWDADIVWVGMGSPKQDYVAQHLADRLGCVCVGVGAAFAFSAGTAREAPRWVQRSGMEWAFRLAHEPRRLGRRYVFGNTLFLFLILRQLISRSAESQPTPSQRSSLCREDYS